MGFAWKFRGSGVGRWFLPPFRVLWRRVRENM